MNRLLSLLLASILVLALPIGCSSSTPSAAPTPGASCATGQTMCGAQCVALASNSANCGKCGMACAAGSACVSGACACQAGAQSCGGQCLNVSVDPNNCGGCGVKCQSGQLCTQSGAASSCQCAAGLMNCGGACVDVKASAANCGACNMACGAGLVCSLGGCKAGCDPGLTQCGQSCVDTKTSVANCGVCGTACAAGQLCNNGACGCPGGQLSCSGQCVDSMNDGLHCGGCDTQCGGGRTCGGGVCNCPAGQSFCSGSCVAGTSCPGGGMGGASGMGGSGAGGASGSGGSGGNSAGAGGSGGGTVVETPVDLNCTADGKTFTVPAADVISDFRGMPINYATGKRGDTGWYAYGAEDPKGASTGASTPGVGSNAFAIDAAAKGPCNSGGSLKVSSTGNDGSAGWGVGFGVNMMPTVAGVTGKAKYDAKAAGYTGIGFFMKCQAETDFAYVKVVDAANDADVANPVCSYATGAPVVCNQYGQKNATITTDWSYFKVHFGETLQDWEGGTITTSGLDASALTAFQIQMNTKYTRDGSARVKNGFTCWIDDVHFVKDTPPSASAAAMPKTCTSNAAGSAPGGYYTTTGSGAITDCKTGQAKIFRGVARPSFEWDRAGWNITYEDLSRIAAWKANVVRFSLNQSFWLDPAKGALYQAYVDRAVKWTLSLGMDVILDLHWLTMGQTTISDSNSPAFWTSVAKKYAGEGRVLFELFNEPHDVDAANVWKPAMTGMYNAARSAGGAKNLVMLGGLDWAYNLSQVLPANAVSGTNIAYVTHPYSFKAPNTAAWDAAFGNLAATYPIIATEFGNANTQGGGAGLSCDPTFYSNIISYFATKKIGWTAWAWFVDRGTDPSQSCGFPQVITSYSGTTNSAGAVIKTALGN